MLRDYKAYRTVFVDSDLQNWRTDQGAASDQNGIYTVTNDEGGLSISVIDERTRRGSLPFTVSSRLRYL